MRRVMTMANMPSLSASILFLPISKVVVSNAMVISPRLTPPAGTPPLRIRDNSAFLRSCRRAPDSRASCRPALPGQQAYPHDGSSRRRIWDKSSCSFALPSRPPCLAVQSNVVSAVAQSFRHPDKFVQKFVGAGHKGLIKQLARLVEHFAYGTEVNVPENINQSKFTHDRQKVLDRP